MDKRRSGQSRIQSATTKLTRKHKPDYQIVLFMGLLMLLGLIVIYAIGPQRAHVLNSSYGTDFYTGPYFFIKQSISLAFALAVFILMAKLPYRTVQKHAGKLVVIGLVACAVLAVAGSLKLGIAQCSLGACRWFDLGPLGSVQPAEFLKFALLIFVASFLGMRVNEETVNDKNKTLIPMGVLIFVAIIFVIGIQKDMGTGAAMIAMLATMFTVAGLKRRVGALLVALAVGLGIIMIVIAPHRIERITTFFAGDTAATSAESYHITHAKIAIGSGGITGVGIGNSVQATGYLPEAINDSVFAIMGETFGFIGLVTILGLFMALLLRLLRVADLLPDMTAKLIAVGVFGWLGAHVVLNVAAMTGVFPLTGITLPLLSFGGTSMVFIAGGLGLVFQLSQYTTHQAVKEGEDYESSHSRRGVGRPRYASRSSS